MKPFLAFALIIVALPVFAVQPPLPEQFLGDWVPFDAPCDSILKLRVKADHVFLVNGSDTQAFGDLDLCFSCEGGNRYSGIVVWLAPEFSKSVPAPFLVSFNANEESGVTIIEIKEPDLKERFPLDGIRLQKCLKD